MQAAFGGVEVVLGDLAVERELDQRRVPLDEFAHRRVALVLAQLARVAAVGGDGDVGLGDEPLLLVEGFEGGALAGLVAVEGEDDAPVRGLGVEQEPAQDADVLGAERGAAGGDRYGDAGEVAGHDVGVALHDDHAPGLGYLPAGQVDPVQHLGFLVQGRLGRVEVFRALVVLEELAGAEADGRARGVADGPDEAAAEPVDEAAAAAGFGQARAGQFLGGEAFGAQVLGEGVPGVGGVAAAEGVGGRAVEAAVGEEAAGDLGVGFDQLAGVEGGGGGVGLQEALLEAGLVGRAAADAPVDVLIGQFYAGPGGEALDGLDEGEPVEFGEECDGVAADAAAEAVVDAAGGRDVEAGRAFVVERAQPFEVAAAGVAERDPFADHLGDVDAFAHQLNVSVPDTARHCSPLFEDDTILPPRADASVTAAGACEPGVSAASAAREGAPFILLHSVRGIRLLCQAEGNAMSRKAFGGTPLSTMFLSRSCADHSARSCSAIR